MHITSGEPQAETVKVRVLVASGLALVLEAICNSIQHCGGIEVVGRACDGRSSIEQTKSLQPDVVIIDASTRELDSFEAANRLSKEMPDCKVIVLARDAKRERVADALVAGAQGCLPMTTRGADLASAVKEVHRGEMYLHPSLTRCVVEDYIRLTKGENGDPYERLTAKEKRVLKLVGEGQSPVQLARRLGISVRTAECHIARIMNKLSIHSRGLLIRYAVKRGLTEF